VKQMGNTSLLWRPPNTSRQLALCFGPIGSDAIVSTKDCASHSTSCKDTAPVTFKPLWEQGRVLGRMQTGIRMAVQQVRGDSFSWVVRTVLSVCLHWRQK
jgi:hypothetical protein